MQVEGWPFRLLHDIGLQVRPKRFTQEVVGILDGLDRFPRLSLGCLGIRATRKVVHTDQLPSQTVEDWRELARHGIVVVLRVVGRHDVHIALEQPPRLLGVIGSVDPRVVADSHALGELHLGDFGLHRRVVETQLLDLDELIWVNGPLDLLGELLCIHNGPLSRIQQRLVEGTGVHAMEQHLQQPSRSGR